MSDDPEIWQVYSDATDEWLTPMRDWSFYRGEAGAWTESRADSVAGKACGGDQYMISLIKIGDDPSEGDECDS